MSEFICVIWKVEHGSAAFLRVPNGKTIMLDAGSSEDFSPVEYLKENYSLNSEEKRADKIIISHADRDHITDLPSIYDLVKPRILSRNRKVPEEILYPDGTADLKDPLYTFRKMDLEYTYPISSYDEETPISNWGDALIRTFFVCPNDLVDCPAEKMKNNLSVLTYVKYGNVEIVFPGDLEPLGWAALLEKTDILDYVGTANTRILIASHHGRKSGVRYEYEGKEYIYEDFLINMKPHLVIMSDKRGTETTDAEAYLPYCIGTQVYYPETKKWELKKVLTTKTNNCVSVFYANDRVIISAH